MASSFTKLTKNLWTWALKNSQDSLITPGDAQLDLKNSILSELQQLCNPGSWNDRSRSDGTEGPGSRFHFLKSARRKHTRSSQHPRRGRAVCSLFVCGCFAYNDIGSILCHERQVNLFEEQKLCSIWEKPNRESLVDSWSFCIYSVHSPLANSALILRGKVPPLEAVWV